MSNIVDFNKRLEGKKEDKRQEEIESGEIMILLCPECEGTEFNVTQDLDIICNDCDGDFPYMMLMLETAEHVSFEELEDLIEDGTIDLDSPLEDDE